MLYRIFPPIIFELITILAPITNFSAYVFRKNKRYDKFYTDFT